MGASLEALVPELRGVAVEFVQWLGAQGVQPRVTSTLRTSAEQTRLYNRYIQGISQFPAAPPGQSAHEYGWAFDLVVSPYEYQEAVGQAWIEIGGSWGGQRDPVHFELPGASAAAAAPTEAPSGGGAIWDYLMDAADFGLGSVTASILALFPRFSESKILRVLGSPVRTFRDHVTNFGLQSLINLVAARKK